MSISSRHRNNPFEEDLEAEVTAQLTGAPSSSSNRPTPDPSILETGTPVSEIRSEQTTGNTLLSNPAHGESAGIAVPEIQIEDPARTGSSSIGHPEEGGDAEEEERPPPTPERPHTSNAVPLADDVPSPAYRPTDPGNAVPELELAGETAPDVPPPAYSEVDPNSSTGQQQEVNIYQRPPSAPPTRHRVGVFQRPPGAPPALTSSNNTTNYFRPSGPPPASPGLPPRPVASSNLNANDTSPSLPPRPVSPGVPPRNYRSEDHQMGNSNGNPSNHAHSSSVYPGRANPTFSNTWSY